MFEFLTRVCALGSVHLSNLLSITHQFILQSRRGSRHSFHRRNWVAERGEILTYRGNFWHNTPTGQWDLHPVSPSRTLRTNFLIVENIDALQSANSHTLMAHGPVQCRCS